MTPVSFPFEIFTYREPGRLYLAAAFATRTDHLRDFLYVVGAVVKSWVPDVDGRLCSMEVVAAIGEVG